MSQPVRKITVPTFREQAGSGRGLTMLTAYDYLWAGIFDDAGVDSILVGDSLAMVVQGRSSTLPVTLGQMIYHGELVSHREAGAGCRGHAIYELPGECSSGGPKCRADHQADRL